MITMSFNPPTELNNTCDGPSDVKLEGKKSENRRRPFPLNRNLMYQSRIKAARQMRILDAVPAAKKGKRRHFITGKVTNSKMLSQTRLLKLKRVQNRLKNPGAIPKSSLKSVKGSYHTVTNGRLAHNNHDTKKSIVRGQSETKVNGSPPLCDGDTTMKNTWITQILQQKRIQTMAAMAKLIEDLPEFNQVSQFEQYDRLYALHNALDKRVHPMREILKTMRLLWGPSHFDKAIGEFCRKSNEANEEVNAKPWREAKMESDCTTEKKVAVFPMDEDEDTSLNEEPVDLDSAPQNCSDMAVVPVDFQQDSPSFIALDKEMDLMFKSPACSQAINMRGETNSNSIHYVGNSYACEINTIDQPEDNMDLY